MYDHNQTLVPDSFLALFVRHERLSVERSEAERRYELAEDLATHIARAPWVAAADGERERAAVLERCRTGLLTEPAQVSGPEAGWILRRVAELQDWNWADLGIV